jgi:hypothetical protein
MGGSVTVVPEFVEFTCYCTQLILRTVFIVKSRRVPVAGSFAVTACIWNVAIYTSGPK